MDQVRTIPPAHQHAGERKPLTLGHPGFEGFEVIQTIETAHSPGWWMFYIWNCRGMAGPKLTAADIVAYPGLKLLLRASQRPEAAPLELGLDGFNTRFPGIAAWTHTGWSSS